MTKPQTPAQLAGRLLLQFQVAAAWGTFTWSETENHCKAIVSEENGSVFQIVLHLTMIPLPKARGVYRTLWLRSQWLMLFRLETSHQLLAQAELRCHYSTDTHSGKGQ